MKNLSLKAKISYLVVASCIISAFAVFVISTTIARKELVKASQNQLESIASLAQNRIQQYFLQSKEFAEVLGEDRLVEGLFLAYESAFYAAGYEIGEDNDIELSDFKSQDSIYQERVKDLLKNYGFHNLLLANIDGQIIFSANSDKEKQLLGKSLSEGDLANSHLADCFNDSMDGEQKEVRFYDFTFVPMIDRTKAILCIKSLAEFEHLSEGIKIGDSLGVVIVELSLEEINQILSNRAGMGETGQSYLVADDHLLRSDLFLNPEVYNSKNSIKNNLKIESESIEKAIAGSSGYHITKGPLGEEVASVFTSLSVFDKPWALVSEKNTSEIYSPINHMISLSFIGIIVLVLIALFAANFVAKAFADPLAQIVTQLSKYAKGLETDSDGMRGSAEKLSEAVTEQSAVVEETKAGLNRIMEGSIQNLEGAQKSQKISENVSSETSSAHMQMQSLVDAMQGIKDSFEGINQMVEIIQGVGDKTEVMNSIAFKTQMLSFNASIEAARAGAAGRGFAVVAQEVGQLAEMSSKAATEIEEAIKQTLNQVESLTGTSKSNVARGEQLVAETSMLLDRVVKGTTIVKESSVDIFNSSTEQSDGVKEMNIAVEQILIAVNAGEKEAIQAKERSQQLAKQATGLSAISEAMQKLIYGAKNESSSSEKIHKLKPKKIFDSLKRKSS
ncbi:MAG: methyl-accepting chemotaxis protein [Bdellovibrionota bacterium]|nr:methyl-accepting chemotaxis protein [Bdellovibrionota bacterium]